ncbi:flagellar biosynthesis anti-sigma factor FlgM [Acidovorax sp. Leaf76]|jgi:negative regulator of flagellin synthesis FlgM|uniref:flagellar biosynthesis anti-sigma factor FlgM n=1 Tax=unclassified Acidovorax TaxID=2684926 RepID=UPI0006F4C225|nr:MULTISPECIES: flagellar biosynthesis anti-sigma factor FlgM [unclassified Acidovorax]KQO13880.1 flagellar biosynthesis anti-sigma factor FlgM [Acidovorax sp. Leaf76]KQO31400.1 flagellar biosynthesis anti-sigma factor FlgM [Acidovorax sp. Leaf84]KQS27421.1 flagellar biosynthesis anti-sigma factor FlgM [Acidovorax sp. Leaf191]
MKIGQKPELPGGLPQTGLAKQAKPPATAAEGATKDALTASAVGVPVTVSTAARALDQTARTTADFDASKVKAVRTAIEKGTFSVDAEAIADKMLSNAQEILSRSRG